MLPSKIAHKINDVPSEKTTETLFVSNAFHYLKILYPCVHVSLFAPSQTDEDILGYDARFVGAGFAFEILIQFKKSELNSNVFTIKLDHTPSKYYSRSQHQVLQRYPDRTAFYVAPTFKTYGELASKQTINPQAFLDHFVAVDAVKLSHDTTRIKYEAHTGGAPIDVRHLEKHARDYDSLSLHHPSDWLKGSELFQRFIGGVIRKSKSNKLNFPGIRTDEISGSLVKFYDNFNQRVRWYSAERIIDRSYGQIIEYDSYDDYAIGISQEEIFRLGSTGRYIFRVYDPFRSEDR